MSFLPEDYKTPKNSYNYMKLQDGENKIRILSSPIMGWEDWIEKRPIRYHMDNRPSKSYDPKKPVRHFWAMIVWNYLEERIQILHITQATIRTNIEALCKDSEWGTPFFYDIKIIRKGEGTDTEYMVNPLPHKPLNPMIKIKFHENPCNLDALFDNGDPFAESEKYTDGVFDPNTLSTDILQEKPKVEKITPKQSEELEAIFMECDPKAYLAIMNALKLKTMQDVPANLFDRMKAKAMQMKAEFVFKMTQEDPFDALEVANV